MREEWKMKDLTQSPFMVDTSWKLLFGCATALLMLIEGSGIYYLLFKSGKLRTIENMVYVVLPWIAALLALRSLRKITGLKNLENATFWWPRFCIAFLICFTYVLVIEGVGILADWLK